MMRPPTGENGRAACATGMQIYLAAGWLARASVMIIIPAAGCATPKWRNESLRPRCAAQSQKPRVESRELSVAHIKLECWRAFRFRRDSRSGPRRKLSSFFELSSLSQLRRLRKLDSGLPLSEGADHSRPPPLNLPPTFIRATTKRRRER